MSGELSKKTIVEFLKNRGLVDEIVNHSIQVSETAVKIASLISATGHKVDEKTVMAGGLLHDVGLSKSSGPIDYNSAMNTPIRDHCVLGANIAREAGFPEGVVNCIECHELWKGDEATAAGFPTPVKSDYIPRAWEAKAVAYADIVVTTKAAGYDLRKDRGAVLKVYRPYIEKCFDNIARENGPKVESLLKRINEFHRSMVQYTPNDNTRA